MKKKVKIGEAVEHYKARVATKDYAQQKRVDCKKKFSPTMRMTTIHLILAIGLSLDQELYQIDVKTAFLNGK